MISEEPAKQNYTRTGKYYIHLKILAKEKQRICYICGTKALYILFKTLLATNKNLKIIKLGCKVSCSHQIKKLLLQVLRAYVFFVHPYCTCNSCRNVTTHHALGMLRKLSKHIKGWYAY